MAVDLDKIRSKYEDLKRKSKGSKDFMQLEDGDNLVRFRSDDNGDFYFETGYHYIKQGKDKVAVVCNKLHDGSECYLCDVVDALYKGKDKGDKELAKDLQAKARIFFCVVDRSDGKTKILGTGNSIFKDLLKYFSDEDWGDLTDPKTGHDVVITKSGTGMDTEYAVMPKPKTTPLGVDDDYLDLSAAATPFTVEEQEMVLNGVSTDEIFKRREAEGGETKPAAKPEKPAAAKKPEPSKATPQRKPVKTALTPEEIYAEKIAMIDLDIPKASKLLKVWLEDDERTEEELDELIAKYPKEETAEDPEPGAEAEAADTSQDSEDVQDEIRKALAKFKKPTK